MNLTCLKSGIWQAELRVPEALVACLGVTGGYASGWC